MGWFVQNYLTKYSQKIITLLWFRLRARCFLLILKSHYIHWAIFSKLIQKKTHEKSSLCGDWGCERGIFSYFKVAYVRWFAQNDFAKKLTKNHHSVVIEAPGAVFLLILKSHTLGDLLKIISQKNQKKIIALWWLRLRTRFFCLFLSRIHWMIFSKLIHKKTQK